MVYLQKTGMIEELKYAEILQENKRLAEDFQILDTRISVLSNTTVHQLKDILEYQLRSNKIAANVVVGDYDNIVQDSLQHQDSKAVLIFYELANIVESLPFEIELMGQEKIDELYQKISSEVEFILQNLKNTPLVVMSKFSHAPFSFSSARPLQKLENLCNQLNRKLVSLAENSSNLKLLEIDKIYAALSINEAIDLRYFYSSKMLYSIQFHKEYCQLVFPHFLSLAGLAKKAIVLDCDNTLWKGILGEDGFDSIEMSKSTPSGKAYREVQLLLKSLSKQGVLLNLCSKNNPEDVEQVLNEHPDMSISQEELIIKKVNWQDKVTNIQEIAKELNIGLDSLVFIDDSDFEVNFVRENLPQVSVFQVPKKAYLYPAMVREISNLFFKDENSNEDQKRTQMYKEELARKSEKESFSSLDDYISSLDLKVNFHINDLEQVSRLAQMTQKTNQFNLTTKRYAEQEMENFILSDHHLVMSIDISDKYGDYGITGLAIGKIENQIAEIDTLLMSCRILGRRIEEVFFDEIVQTFKEYSCKLINSCFLPTHKNAQVSNYFDRMGMKLKKEAEGLKEYTLDVSQHNLIGPDYIAVTRINNHKA